MPSAEFVFVNPSKDSDVLDLSLQVSVPGLAPFYSVALRSAVRGKYHLLTGVGEDVKLVVDLPSNASPKMIYEAARMFEDEVATLVRAYCSMYSDNLTSPRHHTTPVADLQIEARDDLSSIIQTALARVSKALGFETSDS